MTVKTPLSLFRSMAALAILLFSILLVSCDKEETLVNPQTESVQMNPNNLDEPGNPGITDRAASTPRLAIKMILSGPYNSSTQLMNDALRSLSVFPLTSPYGTGETISSSVLSVTGSNAIVDWVKVELRTGNTTIVKTVSGLLQRDGDVVDTDGTTALGFPGVSTSTAYQVAVHHRNHLGCLTTGTFTPSTSSPPTVDLTAASTGTWSSSNAVGRRAVGSKMGFRG